jgi:uncharacterized protein (DUF1330 family)
LTSKSDSVEYELYRKLAYPVIAEFAGKYLVRGGMTEIREGDGSQIASSSSSSKICRAPRIYEAEEYPGTRRGFEMREEDPGYRRWRVQLISEFTIQLPRQ